MPRVVLRRGFFIDNLRRVNANNKQYLSAAVLSHHSVVERAVDQPRSGLAQYPAPHRGRRQQRAEAAHLQSGTAIRRIRFSTTARRLTLTVTAV
jgi:hypothetical protein